MSTITRWQVGQADAENLNALTAIQQWWSNIPGQPLLWQQRILGEAADQISWERQRFDEDLNFDTADLRGVTLFWRKAGETQERNLTAAKLELDPTQQQLDIYSQVQANLVVRITVLQPKLQVLKLVDPELDYQAQAGQHVMLIRDRKQNLEVQIILSSDRYSQLQQQLSSDTNSGA
jgi:hypothetical protein